MAKHLKIPEHVRHEFLRRLYCIGLSDENIDIVIHDMWYRFKVGEFTEKRHSEIREAFETSNPLSQTCHTRMRDYWEELPKLPNGLILSPLVESLACYLHVEAQIGRHIRIIECLLENVEDTAGTDPIVNDYVIMLLAHLLRFDKLAFMGLDLYFSRLDAQENATSDSDGLRRLLVLLGEDGIPPDRGDWISDANEEVIPIRPAIRV